MNELFSGEIPRNWTWVGLHDMLTILNKIGSVPNLNHTFSPTGGGLDLTAARLSKEPECIELDFDGIVSILKPRKLTFDSFGDDWEWAYFRIECSSLKPSGIYEATTRKSEELTEINPAQYKERSVWDDGFFGRDENGDEIPLPRHARAVTRHFSGAFVIFAKGSIYNANPGTYDARHNKMTEDEFRKHIQAAIDYVRNQEK